VNMNSHIKIPKDKIDAFCQEHHIRRMGFSARSCTRIFIPQRNRILISFDEQHRPEPARIVEMRDELAKIFGQNVELMERQAVGEKPESCSPAAYPQICGIDFTRLKIKSSGNLRD